MTSDRDLTFKTDVLVIGSEGAGASSAIAISKMGLDVLVATKGSDVGRSGATVTIDGELSCDSRSIHEMFNLPGSDPTDSKDLFFQDMVKASKYLSDQKLVEIHVDGAPQAVKRIMGWGIKLDRVIPSSGHSRPRGLTVPGVKFGPVMRRAFHRSGARILPFTMITDLLKNGERCLGAVGLNVQTGRFVTVKAKAVILASGGGQRVYPVVTAPEELTGDGQVMAYRAGARLINMEFPMFLPGVFLSPPAVHGVDVPFALSTCGLVHAWLLNCYGERFMKRWDPVRMEHSTRDILSIAMGMEVEQGRGSPNGGIYVSLSHLPKNLIDNLRNVLPPDYVYKYGGFNMEDYLPDLSTTAIEACPGCHFFNGGIKINRNCETNIKGLFAAGEVSGGVHGGNRLSGNAFTEILVFGHRAGLKAAAFAESMKHTQIDKTQVEELKERVMKPFGSKGTVSSIDLRKKLQNLAWSKVGVIREEKVLEQALIDLKEIQEQIPEIGLVNKSPIYNREWMRALELESMATTLEFIIRASLERKESRAALYKRDYPRTDNNKWLKIVAIEKRDGSMITEHEPVVITKIKPPEGIYEYGFLGERERIDG